MPTEIVALQMLAQSEGLHDADSEQADRSAGRLTSQPQNRPSQSDRDRIEFPKQPPS